MTPERIIKELPEPPKREREGRTTIALDGGCGRCGQENMQGWIVLVGGAEHILHPCDGALVLHYNNYAGGSHEGCPFCEELEGPVELVHSHRVNLELWSSHGQSQATEHDSTVPNEA